MFKFEGFLFGVFVDVSIIAGRHFGTGTYENDSIFR